MSMIHEFNTDAMTDALNGYAGMDIWNDIVTNTPGFEVDEHATDTVDPNFTGSVFVANGHVYRYLPERDYWIIDGEW